MLAKDPPRLTDLFQQKHSEWKDVTFEGSIWKTEWSGKDVLLTAEQHFAGEFGWASKRVRWDEMQRADAAGLARQIEWELQPALVSGFLRWLTTGSTTVVSDEWTKVRNVIQEAAVADRPEN